MSVLVQRLKDEYGAEVCVTAPTVPYKGSSRGVFFSDMAHRLILCLIVVYKNGNEEIVSNPALFPDTFDAGQRIDRVEEPIGEPP
jgi:translation elongation factor EF-4